MKICIIFHLDIQLFQYHCWRIFLFLIGLFWCLCKKKQLNWPFNIELFSDYSCSICLSIFVPIPYCLDYYMFIVTTEIRQCKPSKLVFFSIIFSLLFCIFYVIYISLYLLASAANLFGIALTVYQFRKNVWYWVFQSVNM